ncbi:MAG: hypothetical protein R2682_03085 [Pyrinomonadaceae bacterium]
MSDAWQMQEPVFRTSEGEIVKPRAKEAGVPPQLPQTEAASSGEDAAVLEALYAPPENVKAENSDAAAAAAPAPMAFASAEPAFVEAGGAIVEQPYVSEEYDVEEINAAVAAASPRKRSMGGLIFKLLAAAVVLGALAVAIIFLAWFLFMRPTE